MQEEIFFPKSISTCVNRGCLASPEVNTSFSSFSKVNPSWSEQERNFQPFLPKNYTFGNLERENLSNFIPPEGFSKRKTKEGLNRGNYCFSDYSRDLKDRKRS